MSMVIKPFKKKKKPDHGLLSCKKYLLDPDRISKIASRQACVGGGGEAAEVILRGLRRAIKPKRLAEICEIEKAQSGCIAGECSWLAQIWSGCCSNPAVRWAWSEPRCAGHGSFQEGTFIVSTAWALWGGFISVCLFHQAANFLSAELPITPSGPPAADT